MKAAVFEEAGKVEVEDVAMPTIQDPEDVIIKVVRTCVCGSDLWAYSAGDAKEKHSVNDGHEAIGIVEETGSAITTVKKGDFVIVPFTHGCGHCAACLAGYDGTCDNHPATPTGAMGHKVNTSASHTATGPWLRYQASQKTTPKGC